MSEFKGTKGVWQINPLNNPTTPRYFCIYTKEGDHKTVSHVALIDKDNHINEVEAEYNALLISKAPEMIIFCAFNQMYDVAELGKRYGLKNYIPLIFRKKFSAQVLKANMKIVGNCEYGLLLYRDKLPKFNNNGKMVFNCIEWIDDNDKNNYPKLHPTQKPIGLLKRLIKLFTDEGEVVIDPCAGSGSSLVAALELNRRAYGFEIDKEFYPKAKSWIEATIQRKIDIEKYGYPKTEVDKSGVNLFTEYVI